MKDFNILFVAPFQLSIRNFLFSGLARQCRVDLNANVVFATPYNIVDLTDDQGESFKNYYIRSSLTHGGVQNPLGTSKILRLIRLIRVRIFAIEYPNASLQMYSLASRRNAIWVLCKIISFMFPKGSRARLLGRLLVENINPVHDGVAKVIAEIKPKVVVVASHGVFELDLLFQIEAMRKKIPTCCIIASWDNLYSRGPMMRRPDLLLVWSKVMRDQAIKIHQFQQEKIGVVGPLQFVPYGRPIKGNNINSELAKLGLSSQDEYFFYVSGARTPEYDCEDIERMVEILQQSEFKNVKIIFRPHPQSPLGAYKSLKRLPIIFDMVPNINREDADALCFNISEINHMACLLSKAKVVISSWGTTALLEAAIFDRPILQLRWMRAFPRKNKEQTEMVKMFQKYMHLTDFDKCHCRVFSDSPDSLVNDILNLIHNNKQYSEGRKKAIETLTTLPLESSVQRTIAWLKRIIG